MYFCVFSLGFKLDFSPKSGIKYISSAIEQEQQFFCGVCMRKAYERAIEGVCIHFKCGYAEYSNRKERENNFTVFQLEFKRIQTKMMVNQKCGTTKSGTNSVYDLLKHTHAHVSRQLERPFFVCKTNIKYDESFFFVHLVRLKVLQRHFDRSAFRFYENW